ncbi:MAG: RnfABCDGE type electron transport complex subunit G [Oscillospiraceae bacterium]|jgi:electron transport complex protein RnfG|nr:RnfABCDGE type electron transport complex subunit G [Oscillospiraceae bacterium]
MKNALYIARLTGVLLLLTAVVAGMLAFVNSITKDSIAAQTAEKADAAKRQVLEAETYTALDTGDNAAIKEAYVADELGFVVRVAPNGYGGEIDMMVGISADGKITGVAIISHAETASLGAEATREDWRAQFEGLGGSVAVDKDGGAIEALTGATVTSRAVVKGVNDALAFVESLGVLE